MSCREDIKACEVRLPIAPARTKIIELLVSISISVFLPSTLRSLTVPISISESPKYALVTSTKKNIYQKPEKT